MKTVSVVIAAHNEAPTIADVVKRARAAVDGETDTECVEVLVIDDGSSDGTYGAAESAGARTLRLAPNQGKGKALRVGIEASVGDWLVFLDADGQDDPDEIPKLLAEAKPDVGLVNGSRFLGRMERGAISRPNWVGNVAMTGLFDLAFGTKITDSQAGFRAISGEIARGLILSSVEYEIETEMLAKVLRAGHRVVEVPVTRYPRAAGATDFRRVRNGLRILRTIIKERFDIPAHVGVA
jgi:glycosyltransferase involved in cell wall biosynthesis